MVGAFKRVAAISVALKSNRHQNLTGKNFAKKILSEHGKSAHVVAAAQPLGGVAASRGIANCGGATSSTAAGTATASVHRAPPIERGSSSSERGGGLGDAARLGADASASILAPPRVDSVASNVSSSAATSRGSEASVVACGGGVRHLDFKVASTAVALGGAEGVDGAVARGLPSAEHGVGYYFGRAPHAERRGAWRRAIWRGGAWRASVAWRDVIATRLASVAARGEAPTRRASERERDRDRAFPG